MKCNEYFSTIVLGDLIYAGHLKSKLYIDIKTSYMLLEELKSLGFLINFYEVYCNSCSKSKGVFLKEISDFKIDSCCDFCNHELDPLKDVIVLYKVVAI